VASTVRMSVVPADALSRSAAMTMSDILKLDDDHDDDLDARSTLAAARCRRGAEGSPAVVA
jgi:hypothetical protein